MLGDTQDFTDEIARANNLTLLMHVINMLPNPVYIKNRQHKWIGVNESYCNLLGYSREELIGQSNYDFFPPEQAKTFWERAEAVFDTKRENVSLNEITNSMGGLCWVEARKSYFQTDDGNEYIIGVYSDITDMKKREDNLIKAQEIASEGERAKANFLSVMSHEIRTPMTGVMGMAQILRNTPLNAQQIEMVNTLESSGDALMMIIDDILDFSSLEGGKIKLNPQSFSLRDMIESLTMLMGVTAREKGLDLIVSIDKYLPKAVIGDMGRLRQILSNLIKNAIKFTKTGYVSVKVFREVTESGTVIKFTVKDTGTGISAAKIETIFDKFSQSDYSTNRVYGGTGLGLSISRKLSELMNGSLTAKSTLGEGSEFYLSLQLPIDTSVQPDPATMQIKVSNIYHKILIVDDVYANYVNLAGILKEMGLRADYAPSAPEAVKRLAQAYRAGQPYTLMLTDYLMPEVDGLCLVTSVRGNAAFNKLNIIALSSVADEEIKETFLGQGVKAYIVKPVRPRELERAIEGLGNESSQFVA